MDQQGGMTRMRGHDMMMPDLYRVKFAILC